MPQTRHPARLAGRMNDAVLRRDRSQARRTLDEAYAQAQEAARAGDFGPAEALRDYLRAYLSAASACGGCDWTSMSRRLPEMRVFRAVKALCPPDDAEEPLTPRRRPCEGAISR